jgi:spermidine synthase
MQFFLIKTIVFISGSVLMSLEIAGSRVLAPYYGSTIFVWSSLITVLLTALAVGYYAGGRLADKRPSFLLWGILLAVAGLLTIAVPFIAGPVNRMLLFRFDDRLGSLVSSCLVFFLPSFVLGIISPFAVKFSVKNISRVGNVTGELYAWSAVGNVLGTLLTAFFLIGRMGVFSIFVTLGAVLLAASGIVFLATASGSRRLASLPVFILPGMFFLLPLPPLIEFSPEEKIVFQKDSFYNHLVVTDDPAAGVRKLRFDKQIEQAGIVLSGNYGSIYSTTSMLHLPVAFSPAMKRVLFIGCGGGIVPRNYFCDYAGVEVDVVEIDPMVIKASRDYFFFFPAPQIRVYADDGRRFVQKAQEKYDVVVMDVFGSVGQIPFHLLTREFFLEVNGILEEEGVVALNLISPLEGKGAELFRSVYKTMSSVFPQTYVFPAVFSDAPQDKIEPQNIIIVATRQQKRLGSEELFNLIDGQVRSGRIRVSHLAESVWFSHRVSDEEMKDALLLTDDFAPVELLYGKFLR